ncbi:MAG: hypothetical protein ABDH28_00180 [Brevinematia bacterium]
MKKLLFVFLTNILFLTHTFSVQNQTISVLPENEKDIVMSMIIEAKLSSSGKLNLYYYFGTIDKEVDKMKFMYDNKLSGLIVVSNNIAKIFTTKGLLTNILLTEGNIETVVSNIIDIFPPKEPEKTLKEIVEIDYVSPLEETKPRHSLLLYVEPTKSWVGFYKTVFETNISGGQTNIYSYEAWFSQKPDVATKYMFGLGYSLDTRYFSLSLLASFEPDPDLSLKTELVGGFWLFKGFMMVGLVLLYERIVFELSNFIEIRGSIHNYDNTLNLYSQIDKIRFENIYLLPNIKLKFSKNDIISFTPFLTLSANIGAENVIIDESVLETTSPRFIGIVLSIETGIFDNFLLGFELKAVTLSIGKGGYLLDNRDIKFTHDVSISESLFLKYRF